jgi:hypothetical protein
VVDGGACGFGFGGRRGVLGAEEDGLGGIEPAVDGIGAPRVVADESAPAANDKECEREEDEGEAGGADGPLGLELEALEADAAPMPAMPRAMSMGTEWAMPR